MKDNCERCMLRGDIEKCDAADCDYHTLWYVDTIKAEVQELEGVSGSLMALAKELVGERETLKAEIESLKAENESLRVCGNCKHYSASCRYEGNINFTNKLCDKWEKRIILPTPEK